MTNEKLNLWQKISEVMKEVKYLCKDDNVQFNTIKYKAISEEKVTSTVRKALINQGLVIMPIEQLHKKEGNLTTVDVKYKLLNIENPSEFEILTSSGTGVDTQDKGVGKAMTYAYKYLLLRTFAIPTGEDPDKISSAELDEKERKEKEKMEKEKTKKDNTKLENKNTITKDAAKQLFYLAKNDAVIVKDILLKNGWVNSTDVTVDKYAEVCAEIVKQMKLKYK